MLLGLCLTEGAELPPPGAVPSCAGCSVSASSGALLVGLLNVQVRAQQNQGEHLPSVPVTLRQVELGPGSRGWLVRAGQGRSAPACLEQFEQLVQGAATGAETGKDQ